MKLLILFIGIGTLYGCYSSEPEKTGMEGKQMPSFNILLSDSTTYFDTNKIQAGKPIVLFIYRPNCPYSRAQMEEMRDNMSIMKNIQFLVITWSNFNGMKGFIADYGLDKYKNITAGQDFNKFVVDHFKVAGVPFTAIFDANKNMISAYTGKIFTKQIIEAIDQ